MKSTPLTILPALIINIPRIWSQEGTLELSGMLPNSSPMRSELITFQELEVNEISMNQNWLRELLHSLTPKTLGSHVCKYMTV